MAIDLADIFDNPDDLADFLMLPNSEQIAYLAKCAANSNKLILSCNISLKGKGNHE